MDYRDLIVTPLVIMIVYLGAFLIRPVATDINTRRYFFPALTLKIIGAIALGFIYQFYYHGGDTFNYHTYGSRAIWNAFSDDFSLGLKLLFSRGNYVPGSYQYVESMAFYHDPSSFNVIRLAAFFDLFTFSTYTATAVLFSVLGFAGGWALFTTFYKKYPHLHFSIALATLFVPSVIFWGSGILKDTIVLAALGFSVYCIDRIFIQHRFRLSTLLLMLVSLYAIWAIRKFVLQAFIPSAVLWLYYKHFIALKSTALKALILPMIMLVFTVTAYYSVIKVGEGDAKYSVEKLAATAQTTAYDIRYWSGREAGSGYSLGELDGSFSSLFRLAPMAVNVALYRPYLWEANNPLMLLAALEGTAFLLLTILIIFRGRFSLPSYVLDPNLVFCVVFAVSFAFAVGVSTFNFGTLTRYRIAMMPFFAIALAIALGKSARVQTEVSEEK